MVEEGGGRGGGGGRREVVWMGCGMEVTSRLTVHNLTHHTPHPLTQAFRHCGAGEGEATKTDTCHTGSTGCD